MPVPRVVGNKVTISELQRQKVLKRWQKNDEIALRNTISDEEERSLLKIQLIAYLQGDGSVSARKEKNRNAIHYEIAFYPDHLKLAKIFVNSYLKVYGKILRIEAMKNYFRIRICQRLACSDLLKTTTFNSLNWRIPIELLNTDQKKREWLKAFFDCEGYVGKKVIQLQSVNKKGIYHINELLKEFGIESKIYKYKRKNKNWNVNYILCIMKANARKIYLNKIGFNHEVKLTKLKKQFYATVT